MKYLLAFTGVLLAGSTFAQFDFALPQRIRPLVDHSEEAELVDLDHDGDLDVLALEDNAIALLANNGQGAFSRVPSTQFYLPTSNNARLLTLADFNGDGHQDLFYKRGYNSFVWRKNNGDLSFGLEQEVFTSTTELVAVGDFNLDGLEDLVIGNSSFENLGLLYGTVFGLSTDLLPVGGSEGLLDLMVSGDFTGDGIPDIAMHYQAPNNAHHLRVLRTLPEGDFTEVYDLQLEHYPSHFTRVDFNGDGVEEIVVNSSYTAGRVNTEGQTFTYEPMDIELDSSIKDIGVADLDNDGDLDLMIAGWAQSFIRWVENVSDGVYVDHFGDYHYNTVIDVDCGDLDGDGITECLFAEEHALGVWDYHIQTDSLQAHLLSVASTSANTYTVVDLDGDGTEEVCCNSDGVFHWTTLTLEEGLDPVHFLDDAIGREMVIVDLDNDGDLDVVRNGLKPNEYGFYNQYCLVWNEQLSPGEFAQQQELVASPTSRIWASDFDGDGDMDLITEYNSSDDFPYNEGTIQWAEQVDGIFQQPETLIPLTDRYADCEPVLTDLNGDGLDDIVYRWNDILNYRINLGGGNLGQNIELPQTDINPQQYLPNDLDGDGDTDILFYAIGGDCVRCWMLNDGSGNLGMVQSIPESENPWSKAWVDLDGDGDLDFLEQGASEALVFMNQGDATFSGPLTTGIEANGLSHNAALLSADFDDDGKQDLVYGDWPVLFVSRNSTGEGCSDPNACNYSPAGTQPELGCCTTCGCGQPNAANYTPVEECQTEPCLYTVKGRVFKDVDVNGAPGPDDVPLPLQQLMVNHDEVALYTDDNGAFSMQLPSGSQKLAMVPGASYPALTSDSILWVYPGAEPTSQLAFMLFPSDQAWALNLELYRHGETVLCNDLVLYDIAFRNYGNLPISGTVEFDLDNIQAGFGPDNTFTEVDGNTASLTFEDLEPGQMLVLPIQVWSPTVDHIGASHTNTVRVDAFSQGSLVVSEEYHLEQVVECAYDPNDKQAFPMGQGPDHRLLVTTPQEFLIRFQNTGNAPAQDVIIVDTLDANFDLNTFEIISNSHSMLVELDQQSREIQFQFFDIQLPDSTCCLLESQGMVSYRIQPLADVLPETRLENTAYIFFDNNHPIITNTTWTTIHACQDPVTLSATDGEECPVTNYVLHSDYETHPGLETAYWWSTEDMVLSEAAQLTLPGHYNGEVALIIENPLCSHSLSLSWDNPDQTPNWFTCPGDLNCDGLINAADVVGLLGQYGCDALCLFEVTGDDIVDSEDLLVVLGAFGTGCE